MNEERNLIFFFSSIVLPMLWVEEICGLDRLEVNAVKERRREGEGTQEVFSFGLGQVHIEFPYLNNSISLCFRLKLWERECEMLACLSVPRL